MIEITKYILYNCLLGILGWVLGSKIFYNVCFFSFSGPITEKIYLGQFNNYKHGINGDLYSMGPKRILIQNFQYDGTGPDAFFWAGVQGSNPSSDGILLGKKNMPLPK